MMDVSGLAKGCDVSHWNGEVNWNALAGMDFVFIKATDGDHISDLEFERNWERSKAAGLRRGAYCFWRPAADPQDIADFLKKTIGPDLGELPPVLDVEASGGALKPDHFSSIQMTLDYIEVFAGRKPFVYTSVGQWDQLGNPAGVSAYPLWLARYGPEPGKLPGDWTDWRVWQHSSNSILPGITGLIDLDVWNGTAEDIVSFIERAA